MKRVTRSTNITCRAPGAMARSARRSALAMHESQSLIIEMQACPQPWFFFEFAAPAMRRAFGVAGPEWTAENLHRAATRVAPSLIRVDADEATYPAHILLRTRLERALLSGDLAVRDLPGAWRDEMRRLLGVTAGNRQRRLPSGHPLDGRRFRLFPHLHAGRYRRGAVVRRRPRGRLRYRAGDRHGRFFPIARLAQDACPRPMEASWTWRHCWSGRPGAGSISQAYTDHLRARYAP